MFFCFVGGNPRYVFILYTKDMKKSFLFSLMAILLAGFWFGGASLADDLTWDYVYDEVSRNAAYEKPALQAYYADNPNEDLWC